MWANQVQRRRFQANHSGGRPARVFQFESLEPRLNLTGHAGVGSAPGDVHCDAETLGIKASDASQAAQATNCFAIDLYQHLNNQEGNLFLSPLSISTALAMTAAGADGETAAEMAEVLRFGSESTIDESFRALLGELNREAENSAELQLANAIWPNNKYEFHDAYFEDISANYLGYAQPLDYTDPNAHEVVNDWVEQNTRGKVQDILPAEVLKPETVMVLSNSIYFNAPWGIEFEETSNRTFTRDDGERIDVPMMSSFADYLEDVRYNVIDGHEVLSIPYEDGRTSLVILLPLSKNHQVPYLPVPRVVREDVSINALSSETLTSVNRWLNSSSVGRASVSIRLPTFETTVASNLKPVLQGMGMPLAFSRQADFSEMTDDPVLVSEVFHKAFVAVNEHGTEAGAATVVVVDPIICFAAGTPVLTADGEKPIEDIEVGDQVLSRSENELNGTIVPKRVEQLFKHEREVIDLHVGGRVIRPTPEHPFYVKGKGWKPAGELEVGDLLATDASSWKAVEKVVTNGDIETVYNFRVASYHTYFVGSEAWGFAIWTHNCCCEPIDFTADRPFHYFIRDNTTSTMLFMGRVMDPTQTENDIAPDVDGERTPAPSSSVAGPPLTNEAGRMYGDANGDGSVNFDDFHQFYWNYTEGFVAEGQGSQYGDFNEDGVLDFADLLLLSANFGKTRL